MAISSEVYDLSKIEVEFRDDEWELAFLKSIPTGNLRLLNESPQPGPDSWPYLMVAIEPQGPESASQVLRWLSDKGIGLAINPHKETPDYVLSYGMIWNYRERGEFISPSEKAHPGQIKFEAQEKVHAGPPSFEYLPEYARAILRSFFQENKIEKIKTLVMSRDMKHYDLCFSLESLGSPHEAEHKGILEAIAWFLPAHYSLVLISEKGLPQFYEL